MYSTIFHHPSYVLTNFKQNGLLTNLFVVRSHLKYLFCLYIIYKFTWQVLWLVIRSKEATCIRPMETIGCFVYYYWFKIFFVWWLLSFQSFLRLLQKFVKFNWSHKNILVFPNSFMDLRRTFINPRSTKVNRMAEAEAFE